jgi:hypothetical protein
MFGKSNMASRAVFDKSDIGRSSRLSVIDKKSFWILKNRAI